MRYAMRAMIFSDIRVTPWLLIAPNLAAAVLFALIPAGRMFFDAVAPAFSADGGFDPTPFVALLTDPGFHHVMALTAALGGCVAIVGTVVGLVLALLLTGAVRSAGLYRNALIWPYAAAAPIAGILWLALALPTFDGDSFGPLPRALAALGWTWPQSFGGLEVFALIAAVCAWRHAGLAVLLLTAALSLPSPTLYDAARLDGAGRRQRFFLIALPTIRPVLQFLLVGGFLSAAVDSFGAAHAIVLSGAAGRDATPSLLVYHIFVAAQNPSPAAAPAAVAQSAVLIIMTAIPSLIQWRLFRKAAS